MSSSTPPSFAPRPEVALEPIMPMVAFWDRSLHCVYANEAYRTWFGRAPSEMIGLPMEQLLGTLFEKNLPFIRGALNGSIQVFERQITLPNGEVREAVATYTPHLVDGEVQGFTAYVTDVTRLHEQKAMMEQAIKGAIDVLEETKRNFRSKKLGQLRAQLEQVNVRLGADAPPPAPISLDKRRSR